MVGKKGKVQKRARKHARGERESRWHSQPGFEAHVGGEPRAGSEGKPIRTFTIENAKVHQQDKRKTPVAGLKEEERESWSEKRPYRGNRNGGGPFTRRWKTTIKVKKMVRNEGSWAWEYKNPSPRKERERKEGQKSSKTMLNRRRVRKTKPNKKQARRCWGRGTCPVGRTRKKGSTWTGPRRVNFTPRGKTGVKKNRKNIAKRSNT